MKTLFQRLQINPLFLVLIFTFAYLDSIRSRVAPDQRLDWYILTPESALISLLQAIVIFFILHISFLWLQGSQQFPLPKKKVVYSFAQGMVLYLLLTNAFSVILSLSFGTWERNYLTEIQISTNVTRILDYIIYGGFYLALRLFRQLTSHRQQINDYELALAESKITHLKQQLNPHFLFNNLNILDELIEENPKSASVFLQNFSELYRYSLKNSDSKLVIWQEELEFAESYFHLISEKFGKAYELKITVDNPQGKLPPLTLQLLIENAVFHNYGTAENPVTIHLIFSKRLTVSNTRIPFKNPRHKSGKGLANLQEQYWILSKDSIQVNEENSLFSVSIPLLP